MRIVKGGTVSRILAGVPVPRMFHARQDFPRPLIARQDIPALVAAELARAGIAALIRSGMRIAITAGSRGIANVDLITRAVADAVAARGARPFIVPAMGSHGGATSEGQREVLAGYGITEATMGCPIDDRMDTVNLGLSARNRPVHVSRAAMESDGIIVSCRIKPHNAFRGTVESGPCKMLAVGLGKHAGAELIHGDGMGVIGANILASAALILEKAPVLGAIPCVENAYDETAMIEGIPAERIIDREAELLCTAFANMPRILVGEADVLIVDEIGKNFSGTGVDPNIAGTFSTEYASGGLKVQRTCFLRLSAESHGNGLGVGLASALTARVFDALDPEKMYPNCLTSTVLRSAMIPMVLPDDREAIQACLKTLNGADAATARVVRIPNTLHIGRIMLSEAYFEDVRRGRWDGLTAEDEPRDLEFAADGSLAEAL